MSLPMSRSGHVVQELGGKLYVIGGTSTERDDEEGGHLADVCVWDESVGVWTAGVPMKMGRYRFAATVVEGRIYALGGITDEGVAASVESWAPGEASWHIEPDMPAPRFGHQALCLSGRLYVIGGLRELEEQDGEFVGNSIMSCTPSAAGTDVHATLPEETQRLLASAATVDAASLSELTEEGLLSSALSKPGWRSEAALPVHVRSFGCVEANGFVYILGGFCLENGRACAKVWRCRAESLVLLGDVMHVYEGQPAEVWPSEHELLQQAAELVSSKFQALLGPGREGGEFVGELRELQLLAQRVADNSVRAAGEFVREFVRDQAPGQGGSDGGGEGSGLGVGEGGVGGE